MWGALSKLKQAAESKLNETTSAVSKLTKELIFDNLEQKDQAEETTPQEQGSQKETRKKIKKPAVIPRPKRGLKAEPKQLPNSSADKLDSKEELANPKEESNILDVEETYVEPKPWGDDLDQLDVDVGVEQEYSNKSETNPGESVQRDSEADILGEQEKKNSPQSLLDIGLEGSQQNAQENDPERALRFEKISELELEHPIKDEHSVEGSLQISDPQYNSPFTTSIARPGENSTLGPELQDSGENGTSLGALNKQLQLQHKKSNMAVRGDSFNKALFGSDVLSENLEDSLSPQRVRNQGDLKFSNFNAQSPNASGSFQNQDSDSLGIIRIQDQGENTIEVKQIESSQQKKLKTLVSADSSESEERSSNPSIIVNSVSPSKNAKPSKFKHTSNKTSENCDHRNKLEADESKIETISEVSDSNISPSICEKSVKNQVFLHQRTCESIEGGEGLELQGELKVGIVNHPEGAILNQFDDQGQDANSQSAISEVRTQNSMAFENGFVPTVQKALILKSESTPFDDKLQKRPQDNSKFGTGAKANITSLDKNSQMINDVSGIVKKFSQNTQSLTSSLHIGGKRQLDESKRLFLEKMSAQPDPFNRVNSINVIQSEGTDLGQLNSDHTNKEDQGSTPGQLTSIHEIVETENRDRKGFEGFNQIQLERFQMLAGAVENHLFNELDQEEGQFVDASTFSPEEESPEKNVKVIEIDLDENLKSAQCSKLESDLEAANYEIQGLRAEIDLVRQNNSKLEKESEAQSDKTKEEEAQAILLRQEIDQMKEEIITLKKFKESQKLAEELQSKLEKAQEEIKYQDEVAKELQGTISQLQETRIKQHVVTDLQRHNDELTSKIALIQEMNLAKVLEFEEKIKSLESELLKSSVISESQSTQNSKIAELELLVEGLKKREQDALVEKDTLAEKLELLEKLNLVKSDEEARKNETNDSEHAKRVEELEKTLADLSSELDGTKSALDSERKSLISKSQQLASTIEQQEKSDKIIAELSEELASKNSNHVATEEHIAQELKAVKDQLALANSLNETLQKNAKEFDSKIAKMEILEKEITDLKNLLESKTKLESQTDQIIQQKSLVIEELESNVNEQKTLLGSKEDEINLLQENERTHLVRIAELESQACGSAELDLKIQRLQLELEKALEQLFSEKSENGKLAEEVKSLQTRIRELEQGKTETLSRLTQELQEKEDQVDLLERSNVTLKAQLDSQLKAFSKLEGELNNSQTKHTEDVTLLNSTIQKTKIENAELKEANSKLQSLAKNAEGLKQKIESLQKSTTESQEENSKLLAENRDQRTKIKKLALEIETLTAEREGYEGRIQVIKSRVSKLESETDQLKSEKIMAEKEIKRLSSDLSNAQSTVHKTQGEASLVDEFRKKASELQDKLEKSLEREEKLKEQLETVQDIVESNQEEKEEAESKLVEVETQMELLKKNQADLHSKISEMQNEISAKEYTAQTTSEVISALRDQIARLEDEKAQLKQEAHSIVGKMKEAVVDTSSLIDKSVIGSFLLNFFDQQGNKRNQGEILETMGRMLDFSAEDMTKIGLEKIRLAKEAED